MILGLNGGLVLPPPRARRFGSSDFVFNLLQDIQDRMNDFMNTIHYFTPCQKAVIVVAHSFFFRTILQKYLHPDIAAKNPELQKRVIKNASCLYIQIDYSGRLPCVTQVEFMFGGGLLEPEKSK